MVVIISVDVLDSISEYASALTHYPITTARAHKKVDLLIDALNSLGTSISTPPLCMNKDLMQTFDGKGNPLNKNLKRYNYQDESGFQWAFACLYDFENDTITILKMMAANHIKESNQHCFNRIVSESINNYLRGIEDRDVRIQRIVRETIERFISQIVA